MKKLAVLLSIILCAYAAHAQKLQKRIDSLVDYYARTFDYDGVAFVSYKGNILLNRGYGYKDHNKNLKHDEHSIFMIGSITKQFTAEIILMLAKENKLQLQDKLDKYFPGYPSGDKITIEHLLTHTSGIYNYTDDTVYDNFNAHPTVVVSKEQMLATFKDIPLGFEPGAKWEYSNSNYVLLTYIIEQVCKKPYTEVVQERILTPLHMTHSGFDYTHLSSINKTVPYNCMLADSFYKAQIEDYSQLLGAGCLYSTAEDLYKWHRALQSYQLLEKEWQDKAYVPYKERYGYGWFVSDDVSGKHAVGHSGGTGGFYTYIMRLDREDVCIVLLSNMRYSGVDLNSMAKNIVKCIYDSSYIIPEPRKVISLNTNVMKRYEGEYALLLDTSISVTFRLDDNRMLFTVTDQPEDRAYPQSETLFFAKTADVQFEFVADGKQGYKLVLRQHGQAFETKRKM